MTDYDVEYVTNCIGDTYVSTAYLWPQRFFDINVSACLSLLGACIKCNIKRMPYLSSTEVYGIAKEEILDENVTLDPVNNYAVSKLATDLVMFTKPPIKRFTSCRLSSI